MAGRKVRTYVYTDTKDKPRLRKLRFEPKAFYMDSWCDERARWVPKIIDAQLHFAEKALYHLPEVLWALQADEPVYWCEGEKDADALRGLGAVATSHWQGALHATRDQAHWFARGAGPVYLVSDVDDAGAACVIVRKRLLLGEGVKRSRMKIIAPPHPYKDAAEAIGAGRALAQFRTPSESRLTAAATRYTARRSGKRGSSDWMGRSA
jgi:hypothetical protein